MLWMVSQSVRAAEVAAAVGAPAGVEAGAVAAVAAGVYHFPTRRTGIDTYLAHHRPEGQATGQEAGVSPLIGWRLTLKSFLAMFEVQLRQFSHSPLLSNAAASVQEL